MCRVLYTLQHGKIASKPIAAHWARGTLGPRWEPLIERALEGRHIPDTAALPEDMAQTLVLLRYVLATGAAMSPG